MSEQNEPRNAKEAIEQGLVKATPEQVDERRALDFPTFELQGVDPAAKTDGDYVCRAPNSEGVVCFVGKCKNGQQFYWVCKAGICMSEAYIRAC